MEVNKQTSFTRVANERALRLYKTSFRTATKTKDVAVN